MSSDSYFIFGRSGSLQLMSIFLGKTLDEFDFFMGLLAIKELCFVTNKRREASRKRSEIMSNVPKNYNQIEHHLQ